MSGYEWMTGKRIVHPPARHGPKKKDSLFLKVLQKPLGSSTVG